MSTLFPKRQTYYTVTGSYVRGEWVQDPPVLGTFKGSIQNDTSKDTDATVQARQDAGKVKVYSSTPLRVGTPDSLYSGDVISWEGQYWEICQALPYTHGLIRHYKYIAYIRPDFQP